MIDRNDEEPDSCLFEEWEGKWTSWRTIMQPDYADRYEKRNSKHGDLAGFKAEMKLMDEWFGGFADGGIYELAEATEQDDKVTLTVVYIGQTDLEDGYSLKERLLDYTRYQSHKMEKINEALNNGRLFQARVLPCTGEMTAKCMKRRVRGTFTYGWNAWNQN